MVIVPAEIKGVASFTSANTAIYKQPGDACSLQFNFSASSVSLKEVEACGAHRGVKCSFDGNYPRKKEPKAENSCETKVLMIVSSCVSPCLIFPRHVNNLIG
jgi:hypothetical protein